ncbi:phosphoenolpyruvate hydrolase family protein [Roseibium sp.]|uniref:phosphoenolpyruvate hydrolase family protein n=1 Tax=Roseibium sp. TaxID=1936156 RepID=UPI003B5195AA
MTNRFKIGAAVGSGIVARAAEEGGADFLLALNAGRLRNMGAPSIACMLPIHDANGITLQFAEREVLPNARVPVYVGLNSWSQTLNIEDMARNILRLGFVGAVNFPSVMHYTPGMKRLLERSGIGVHSEIQLLRTVQKLGGRGLFYCGTREHARDAAAAGLNAIVFNYGWNVGGGKSHVADISLEEAAQKAREVTHTIRKINPNMEVYLEGGPILTAEDLHFVIQFAKIDGYVGGSTIDRFPVQNSVTNQIAEYQSAAAASGTKSRVAQEARANAARYGLVGQSPAFTQFATELLGARASSVPVVLNGAPGSDLQSALNIILDPLRRSRRVSQFDFSQSVSSHRANDEIFGRHGDLTKVTGLLNEGAEIVVLQNSQLMPRLVQGKFASALRSGRVQLVGGHQTRPLTARLIFLTETDSGDLLDRLGSTVLRLRMPTLRERHLDMRLIFNAMVNTLGLEGRMPTIRPAAFRVLSAHDWAENDAELRALVIALSQHSTKTIFEAHDMRAVLGNQSAPPLMPTAQQAMRQQLLEALTQNGFRKTETARVLNISRKTLYNRMKKYGFI